jgi:hypothetical protein
MTQYKYLVKIFTKHLQTKFEIESKKEINNADELNKPIIDFLGKSDIKWEKNDLQYNSTISGFYITYEEVTNGSGQHGIVRKETETRV